MNSHEQPLWQSTFLEAIQERNLIETDCYAQIFTFLSETKHKSQGFLTTTVTGSTPREEWTRLCVTGEQCLESHYSTYSVGDGKESITPSNNTYTLLDNYTTKKKGHHHHHNISDNTTKNTESHELLKHLERARKNKFELEECNMLLRDQVRSYEASFRAMDVEVKAAHLCLRDLEGEIRVRESRIKELDLALTNVCEENRALKEERINLKLSISNLKEDVEDSRKHELLYQSKHPDEPFVDVVDLNKEIEKTFFDPTDETIMYAYNLDEDNNNNPLHKKNTLHISQQQNKEVLNYTYQHDQQKIVNSKHKEIYLPRLMENDEIRSISATKHIKDDIDHYQLQHTLDSSYRLPSVKVIARPHNGAITSLDYNINVLISGGYDGYLAILDPLTLRVGYSFKVSPNDSAIVFVNLSSDYKRAIIACLDSCVYIVTLDKQKVAIALSGHIQNFRITGCYFLNDPQLNSTDRYCVTVSMDKTIRVWDLEITSSGTSPIITLSHLSVNKTASPITASALTFNNSILVLGHQNGSMTLWSLQISTYRYLCIGSIRPLTTTPFCSIHDDAITGISCCVVKNELVLCYSLGRDGRLMESRLLYSKNHNNSDGNQHHHCYGNVRKSFLIPSDFKPAKLWSVPVSFGTYVAVPSQTGIHCWSASTGQCIGSWSTPALTTCLMWSADGNMLTSAHSDGSLLLWWL